MTSQYLAEREKFLRAGIEDVESETAQRVTRGQKIFKRRIAPSLDDGNCLFDAVALCLTDLGREEYDHETVRRETVAHLTSNPKTSDGFPKWDFVDKSRYPSWKKFLNAMSKEGEWGGHVCLEAICELYQVNVQILDTRGPEFDHFMETDHNWPTIYLQFENECHYEALTKVDNIVNHPCNSQREKEASSDGIGGSAIETCLNTSSGFQQRPAVGGHSVGPYDELQRELQAITKAKHFKGKMLCEL